MASIGETIREARKAAGLLQSELAEQSGTSTSTICRVENGFLPRADRLASIARVLALPVADLLESA
jgi:transcriptional regulator with XRE-family HTH domain